MIKITVLNKGLLENKYVFDLEDIRIGREESNNIVLDSLGIKRHHAKISHIGGSYYFLPDEGDVESRGVLKAKDEIAIRSYTLRIDEIN